jgi:hypothetical protein
MWSQIVHVFKKQFMTKVNTEDKQYVYKERFNMREFLKTILEGLVFILFLIVMCAAIFMSCMLIDSCYYYYVPGGF